MDLYLDALARVTLADRDQAQASLDSRTLHPSDAHRLQGQVEAYNLTLASIAGYTGHHDRAGLELYLATTTPAILPTSGAAGPDDDEDEDEPSAAQDARDDGAWDADHAAVLAAQQAELDTQDAAMGGWEPRS